MKRRTFITLLGGAAASVPFAARAQQSAMPVIGFLSSRSLSDSAQLMDGFRQGLQEAGFVEGRNVAIEYRWAEGQYDRLPGLAADLVGRHVAVIATVGGTPSALAARTATTTIPIVFISQSDPVKLGLVASINRPGGNATGATPISSALESKRLGLLRELLPHARRIALLVKTDSPETAAQSADLQKAVQNLALDFRVLDANSESDFEAAFAEMDRYKADALVVGNDPFFNGRREKIIALAARYAVPAIYSFRDYAVSGGLISYGTSLTLVYRQIGVYVGRILKGANPADMPVVQPTAFELVVNLKTAKTLGLTVPPTLLATADEVIE
jgi:putative ABC transport system substrate-binding protein